MSRRTATLMVALALLGGGTAVAQAQQNQAGQVPFYFQSLPPSTQSVLGTYRTFMGSKGSLSPKEKFLIALAVAAQIPCDYCVYANTRFAKKAGATEDEIHDAIATAGFTRLLSTVVQGGQPDMQKFKAAIDAQTSAK